MQSRWSDAEAESHVEHFAAAPGSNEDIALRVYTSRLIGREPTLVLHGGGNTSVKTRLVDDTGALVDVLCVKGSGWELGDIEPSGLPALRLTSLRELRGQSAMTDEAMVNAQRVRLLDASAPNPSVETLLHAFLPAKFVDHSHADAILSLVDQPDAEAVCREVFGGRFAVVPYVMPGFRLAKLAAEIAAAHPEAEGLLLLQHGLFSWGATARESYERHIEAVTLAETRLGVRPRRATIEAPLVDFVEFAPRLRGLLGEPSSAQPRRYFLELRQSAAIRRFVDRPEVGQWSQRGPITPDHVIRTKAFPLIIDDPTNVQAPLADFRDRYRGYFARQTRERPTRAFTALDADPRVVLVRGLGLIGVGSSPRAATIAADLYEHTIDVIDAAESIGRYQALPEQDLFDMEYWSLEQAKLGIQRTRPLEGRIVYVTGAARGIGAATSRAFASQGAALFLVDQNDDVETVARSIGAPWATLDLRDRDAVGASISACVAHYGGLDGVVSNAGVAPQSPIADCPPELLHDSFAINLFAHQWLASHAFAVMKRQRLGGFLLFNASKSAFNPGPDFGPYAVPKAALVALAKQYALEGGSLGIRSNVVNADRIRTELLSIADIEQRALARGLDLDDYFRSNLLGREVTTNDVAQAFVHLALADSTTGCVLTVDGGNIAAAPR